MHQKNISTGWFVLLVLTLYVPVDIFFSHAWTGLPGLNQYLAEDTPLGGRIGYSTPGYVLYLDIRSTRIGDLCKNIPGI